MGLLSALLLAGCGGAQRAQRFPVGTPPESALEPRRNETEAASGAALLESGPVKRHGILFLPPNATGHYQGVYKEGTFTITVRYTEEDIVNPADWVPRRCGGDLVRFTVENGAVHYLYSSEEEWHVFFEIPSYYGKDCAFIERFLQRLRYFKSVVGSAQSVPLPAVVETL